MFGSLMGSNTVTLFSWLLHVCDLEDLILHTGAHQSSKSIETSEVVYNYYPGTCICAILYISNRYGTLPKILILPLSSGYVLSLVHPAIFIIIFNTCHGLMRMYTTYFLSGGQDGPTSSLLERTL